MGGDDQNNLCVCEHTGILPEDIVAAKWTSSDFHPAHFVAVDHRSESIIFAIRGTFHLKDALTDLIARSVTFQSGEAHGGMLKCARKKLEVVKDILLDTLKKYPGYRLVVTGHSLGAGTASLLTMLLKKEYPYLNIHCYAYAPPCVLDVALSHECNSFITSFVLDNDIVPRLSYGSMQYLQECIIRLMGESTSNFHRLVQALAAGGSYSETISKKVANLLRYESHLVDTEILKTNGPRLDKMLLPPGRVYRLMKVDDNDLSPQAKAVIDPPGSPLFQMEISDCGAFAEVIVSGSMFQDHMPNAYNKAINGVLNHQSLVRHGLISDSDHKEAA